MGWTEKDVRSYQKRHGQGGAQKTRQQRQDDRSVEKAVSGFRNTIAAAYEAQYGANHNHGEESFITAWSRYAANIPFPFQRQVMFHPGRNWKFDFYDESVKIAVEVDGRLHQEIEIGGGTRIANKEQAAKDREKRNAAVCDGIWVLVYSAEEVEFQPKMVITQVLEVWQQRKLSKG